MLVSQVHMMAGQNVKKKYLMYQILIKMLKQKATPNSSLHNLKIYISKGCRKTSQRWIGICSLASYAYAYVATYLAKTAILNVRIFSRYHSDYRFLLRLVNTFPIYTDEYIYPAVCYKVNDANTFKNPYILFYSILANHHDWLV